MTELKLYLYKKLRDFFYSIIEDAGHSIFINLIFIFKKELDTIINP